MAKFKGATSSGPLPTRATWTKGKGWTSVRIVKGTLAQLTAEASAMEAFCDRIDLEMDEDGMYGTVTGHFAGQNEGEPDETSVGEVVWGIDYNDQSVDLLDGAAMKDLESVHTGARSVIRKAFDDWKKADANEHVGLFTPATFNDEFTLGGELTQAQNIWFELISGVESIRFFQPVLTYSSTVGRTFTTKKTVPGRPNVYATTAALLAAVPVASNVLFELPQGYWLEHPPRVTESSDGRTEITQRWEWYDTISDVAYP